MRTFKATKGLQLDYISELLVPYDSVYATRSKYLYFEILRTNKQRLFWRLGVCVQSSKPAYFTFKCVFSPLSQIIFTFCCVFTTVSPDFWNFCRILSQVNKVTFRHISSLVSQVMFNCYIIDNKTGNYLHLGGNNCMRSSR